MDYFAEFDGKIYAVMNSKNRRSSEDVMVRVPLDDKQLATYERLKKVGASQSAIFRKLFPRPRIKVPAKGASRRVAIDVDELNKAQVIGLLTFEMGVPLRSLNRMTLADLREMLLAIKAIRSR